MDPRKTVDETGKKSSPSPAGIYKTKRIGEDGNGMVSVQYGGSVTPEKSKATTGSSRSGNESPAFQFRHRLLQKPRRKKSPEGSKGEAHTALTRRNSKFIPDSASKMKPGTSPHSDGPGIGSEGNHRARHSPAKTNGSAGELSPDGGAYANCERADRAGKRKKRHHSGKGIAPLAIDDGMTVVLEGSVAHAVLRSIGKLGPSYKVLQQLDDAAVLDGGGSGAQPLNGNNIGATDAAVETKQQHGPNVPTVNLKCRITSSHSQRLRRVKSGPYKGFVGTQTAVVQVTTFIYPKPARSTKDSQ